MKNSRIGSAWTVLIFLFAIPSALFAQPKELRDLEVVAKDGFYRVLINCNGKVKHVSHTQDGALRVSLYLSDVNVNITHPEQEFRTGLVRRVFAEQWRERPPVAKVDIFLREPFGFEIQEAADGLLFVDIRASAVRQNPPEMETENSVPVVRLASTMGFSPRAAGRLSPPEISKDNQALQSTTPISIDVNQAELSNVLRLMARQSGLNIVASNDVVGNVTVSLARVTIKEALDMVVKANGFDYTVAGDVILVKPRNKFDAIERRTQVYRLKYIDASNMKETVQQIVSVEAKIQVFYHNFHGVNPEMAQEAAGGDAKMARSSILVVTDSEENLKRVGALIEALDSPTPQIMIEAKLVEVSPQHDLKLGIDWDKSITGEIFKEIILPSGTANQVAAEVPLDGGDVSYGTLSLQKYAAVLNFLSTKTNSKLVSNPRIIATDNEEAMISVGTTFPIPQINRGVGGQGDVVSFEYRDVNISLKVTPHVGENQTISLFVNPVVEEVIGEVVAAGNSAPITSLRTVETVVTLKNNETMVIGGLIRENTVDTETKVWLLGDIPLLGNLFRNRDKMKRQTDLLIFITPRIVGTF